jgi:hypothetical protein
MHCARWKRIVTIRNNQNSYGILHLLHLLHHCPMSDVKPNSTKPNPSDPHLVVATWYVFLLDRRGWCLLARVSFDVQKSESTHTAAEDTETDPIVDETTSSSSSSTTTAASAATSTLPIPTAPPPPPPPLQMTTMMPLSPLSFAPLSSSSLSPLSSASPATGLLQMLNANIFSQYLTASAYQQLQQQQLTTALMSLPVAAPTVPSTQLSFNLQPPTSFQPTTAVAPTPTRPPEPRRKRPRSIKKRA